MKFSKNIAIGLVCVLLGTMLAWQYKSVSRNLQAANTVSKRAEDLMETLLAEKHNSEELRKQLEKLQLENNDYKNSSGNYSDYVEKLKKELDTAEVIAGLKDVKGPGVIVTLENNGAFTVEEANILNVINELRASGAQAISVNGERVVATTAIREAGVKYIMINNRQTLAPFEIKAIADPESLERSFKILGGVKENLELYYQITVKVEKASEIDIPKVDSTVIKYDKLTPMN